MNVMPGCRIGHPGFLILKRKSDLFMKQRKYGVAGAVKICFRHAPGVVLIKLILEIISGALMPLMVLVVAFFINSAISYANGGGNQGNLTSLIAALVLMAAYYAYSQVIQIIIRLADNSLENALRENLRPRLVQKHARISFSLLENPETLDLISRVCDNSEKNIAAILNTGIGIIRLCIQAFGILSLLAAHVWQIIPLFLVSAIPIAIIARKGGSTKIADRILLMEEGQICELGTHEQLMTQDGKYAQMYREQAGWYER